MQNNLALTPRLLSAPTLFLASSTLPTRIHFRPQSRPLLHLPLLPITFLKVLTSAIPSALSATLPAPGLAGISTEARQCQCSKIPSCIRVFGDCYACSQSQRLWVCVSYCSWRKEIDGLEFLMGD